MSFKRVYNALGEREQARLEYALAIHHPSPQQSFYTVSRSLKNRSSNRYSNILAYDRTAVFPPLGSAQEESGYLNANVISDGNGWWIASQAPTPSTFQQFFEAIYNRTASKHPLISPYIPAASKEKGKTILVQLTGWEERGVVKADPYLLQGTYGDLDVKIRGGEQRKDMQTRITRMTVNEMEILHYHFEGWPDHGVPDGKGIEALRKLIFEVEQVRDGEVWVHCSAGVGRTGTFIALSSLLYPHTGHIPIPESPLEPLPEEMKNDKVAQTVDRLREWRGMLVQGPDQLRLIYEMTGN